MIRFVIPAYNEHENIPRLLAELAPVARELGARVIFVDDGSTDGTAEAIEAHSDGLPIAIVRHAVNRGLGTAINSGLRAALGESLDDDAIITLEADNTSDLSDLPAMLERFYAGDDIVLASVYAPGGRILGVAPWRLAASKGVSNVFRYAGGLREIHTLSSLYRIYRAGTLRRAVETYGYLLVREPGLRGQRRAAAEALQRRRNRLRGPDRQRLVAPPGRLEDESPPDRPRLRPPDGGPPRRADPAAADLSAGQRDPCRQRAVERVRRQPASRRIGRLMSGAPRPHIGVVGAGILGTALTLRLAQAGARVTLLERAPTPGRPGRRDGFLRPQGRPLLPRHRALGRAHDRDWWRSWA